jgi:hypothetical protein
MYFALQLPKQSPTNKQSTAYSATINCNAIKRWGCINAVSKILYVYSITNILALLRLKDHLLEWDRLQYKSSGIPIQNIPWEVLQTIVRVEYKYWRVPAVPASTR